MEEFFAAGRASSGFDVKRASAASRGLRALFLESAALARRGRALPVALKMTGFENNGDGDPPSGDASPEPPADPLLGAAILIVEDNAFIGAALEEMLLEHGLCVVGVAKTLKQALRLAAAPRIDLGLLDVNIGDQRIDLVAEALEARGAPFVFATGYGRAGLPEAFRDRPVVEKPFYTEEILRTLRDALRQSPSELEAGGSVKES